MSHEMENSYPFSHPLPPAVDLGCFYGVGGDAMSYRAWLKKKNLKNSLDNFNKWLKSERKARIKKYGKQIYGKKQKKH